MNPLTCALGLCLLLLHGQGLIVPAEAVQSVKSALCDAATGDWDPYDINCDFECNGTGWEVRSMMQVSSVLCV